MTKIIPTYVQSNIDAMEDYINKVARLITGQKVITVARLQQAFDFQNEKYQQFIENTEYFPPIILAAKEKQGNIVIVGRYAITPIDKEKFLTKGGFAQTQETYEGAYLFDYLTRLIAKIQRKEDLRHVLIDLATRVTAAFVINEDLILAKSAKDKKIARHAMAIAQIMHASDSNQTIQNAAKNIIDAVKSGKQYKAIKSFGLGNYDVRSLTSEFGENRAEQIMKHAKAIGLDISDEITFA